MNTLTTPFDPGRDHTRGDPQRAVVLVQYGDYQCRFSAHAHAVARTLEEHLGPHIALVYRHYPRAEMHPDAFAAAEAAEAAASQGMFWPMHELLFRTQGALDRASLLDRAAILGLDLDAFGLDLTTHRHAQRIRDDLRTGAMSGVSGTPTFFVDGVRHDGGYGFQPLYEAIMLASSPRGLHGNL